MTRGPKPRRFPPPTPAQIALFESGTDWVDIRARKLGLWRARAAGMEIADLMQAGLLGLWLAALRYDRGRGASFETAAYRAITGAILEAIEVARFGRRNRHGGLIDQSQFEHLDDAA